MPHHAHQPHHAHRPTARPLLVTADSGLQDAVLAVAAEARVDVSVAADVGSAATLWAAAPLVLLDAALVEPALDGLTVPRPGLVVVSRAIEDSMLWRQVVAIGAEHVVELPHGAPWLFERFGRSLDADPTANLVVVAGAVGGAGASTLAAALARHAQNAGMQAVLVDLDPLGGGLDLMVGAEDDTGARWDELAGITGRVDERVLLDALPTAEGLPLLSWPAASDLEPGPSAVGQVLDALCRQPGLVVVDAGRTADPRAAVALAKCQSLVLVVPLRVRAVAAARRLLRRVPAHVAPIVVAREPAPGGLSPDDVTAALGLPVTAVLLDDRRRRVTEELGGPPPSSSAWRRVCAALLDAQAEAVA
ncbi:MAG: septum site-determining protein [Actinomycetia bacterium]|nr:septum site-determining protein [Actinomycetes bacterium]